MTRLSGLIPPLCTPLTDDGRLDRPSLERLIAFQIDAGATGVFVLGSSGEAVYLDDRVRRDVVDVTTGVVGGEVVVLVGALDATVERVIHQVEWIDRFAVDGIVATAPFYADPSAAEVAAHFRAIASSTQRPLFAYDIPANVGRRIDAPVVLELLAAGTLAGLKDSSGTVTEFGVMIDALGPSRTAALMTGADVLAEVAMDLGADGLIPGLANVRPALFSALLDAHRRGARVELRAYQRAITALATIFGVGQRHGLGRHSSELGALKHVLRTEGVIDSAAVSRPLVPLPAPAQREVDAIVRSLDAALEAELAGR